MGGVRFTSKEENAVKVARLLARGGSMSRSIDARVERLERLAK